MNQATMKKSPAAQLETPRFEYGKPLLIAGLRKRFTAETMKDIPELWQRFVPYIGNVPGQVGQMAYGLWFNAPVVDDMDCLVGIEVSRGLQLFKSSGRIQRRGHPCPEIRCFPAPRTCFEAARNSGCHRRVAAGIRTRGPPRKR